MASASTLIHATRDAFQARRAKHAKTVDANVPTAHARFAAAYGAWVSLGVVCGMLLWSVIGQVASW